MLEEPFAEKRGGFFPAERQRPLVFQEDDALPGDLPGQPDAGRVGYISVHTLIPFYGRGPIGVTGGLFLPLLYRFKKGKSI